MHFLKNAPQFCEMYVGFFEEGQNEYDFTDETHLTVSTFYLNDSLNFQTSSLLEYPLEATTPWNHVNNFPTQSNSFAWLKLEIAFGVPHGTNLFPGILCSNFSFLCFYSRILSKRRKRRVYPVCGVEHE